MVSSISGLPEGVLNTPISAQPSVSPASHDFKTLFQRMYELNRDLNQGVINISLGRSPNGTMTIHGVGEVDITNQMGQFILTTTLGEYENIVGAATNLMSLQQKIEDYLQKIV